MRVGLSLLTLVPGISGGSETYARELARALARIGTHEYLALVPPLAPDAGDGLPTIVADRYSSSTTTAGRLRAMGSATLRPARLRSLLDGVDVVHYPLTVPVPRPAQPHVITLHDVQHLDLPELFPRGERLFRKLAYDRAARKATEVIVISEFVRERVIERLGLDPEHVHAVWLGVDHERFTPAPDVQREPLLLYPARPWPHKNHARLFEAFAQIRRRRPELRLVLTGVGHDPRSLPEGVEARSVSGDGARRPLPARRLPRLPEPLRGLRPAAGRGDGVRLPGRRSRSRLAAGGVRRRRRPVRPARPRGDRRRHRRGPRPLRRAERARAAAGRGVHLGRDGPRARPDLRQLLLRPQAVELGVDEQRDEPVEVDGRLASRGAPARVVGSPTRSCSSAVPRRSAGSLRT